MFDLVIVGGGLVGASLALGLAQETKLKILVLEQKEPYTPLGEINNLNNLNNPYDLNQKTLAINQGTKIFFDKLAIWPKELKISDILTPIQAVHVSMQKALGIFRFTPDSNYDALGYIIQIKCLEALLLKKIQENNASQQSLTWVQPMSLLDMERVPLGWKLSYFASDQNKIIQVQTKCLIGADGPDSIVKKKLGIIDRLFEYNHRAIIANVRLKQPHQYMAYERFTQEGGALALLPYGLAQMTLVLTTSVIHAKAYQALSDSEFLAKITDLMGDRLAVEAISARIQVPLQMKIASHQIARRALLMGNAAHLLHPIAAQGFNLSIQDVAALIKMMKGEKNIGSSEMLHNYQSCREAAQKQYVHITDNIARYYSSRRLPAWLKGVSLLSLDNAPIKSYFTKKSMGIV